MDETPEHDDDGFDATAQENVAVVEAEGYPEPEDGDAQDA